MYFSTYVVANMQGWVFRKQHHHSICFGSTALTSFWWPTLVNRYRENTWDTPCQFWGHHSLERCRILNYSYPKMYIAIQKCICHHRSRRTGRLKLVCIYRRIGVFKNITSWFWSATICWSASWKHCIRLSRKDRIIYTLLQKHICCVNMQPKSIHFCHALSALRPFS